MSWLQQYEGTGPTPMKKEDILKNVKYLIPPLYSDGGTPVKISNSPIFSNKSRRLYPDAVNLGFNAEIVLNEIVKEIEKGQWWTSIPEEVVGPDANPDKNPAYREFRRLITAVLEHVIVHLLIQSRKQLESHQRLSLAKTLKLNPGAASPPLSADILALIGTAYRPGPSREVLKKYKEEEASRKVGGSKKNKKRKYNKRKSKKSKKSKKARSKKRS